MNVLDKLIRVAETDVTFSRQDGVWVGRCLICNAALAFDARTGEGATLEHIRARSRGGTEDLLNLGVVHGSCNHEKGSRWDPKHRRDAAEYEALVERMLARRLERWREG
ncbi:MAG: HNH endonuclease [Chloroflexia bacterium]